MVVVVVMVVVCVCVCVVVVVLLSERVCMCGVWWVVCVCTLQSVHHSTKLVNVTCFYP